MFNVGIHPMKHVGSTELRIDFEQRCSGHNWLRKSFDWEGSLHSVLTWDNAAYNKCLDIVSEPPTPVTSPSDIRHRDRKHKYVDLMKFLNLRRRVFLFIPCLFEVSSHWSQNRVMQGARLEFLNWRSFPRPRYSEYHINLEWLLLAKYDCLHSTLSILTGQNNLSIL